MTDVSPEYFNRELSWLEFNQRVLEEACDASVPLLERLRFLAITAANLDEFFMVRVGSLLTAIRTGESNQDPTGLSPLEQLTAISVRTQKMVAEQYRIYLTQLEPQLAEAGIRRRRPNELNERQREIVESVFQEQLQAVLTPIAVHDPVRFPLLFGKTVNVAVKLAGRSPAEPYRFAVIPFGRFDVRYITLPSAGGYEFILTEDVIAMTAERFFPGEEVISTVPFRIIRNADLTVNDDDGTDLLSEMEDLLDDRKDSFCTRLELSDQMTRPMLDFLKTLLRVGERDVYLVPGPVGMSDLIQLADVSGFDQHLYPSWTPCESPQIETGESVFEAMKSRDLLLHHPFESFDPVLRLLSEAADDRDVVAIKQTLYRTSRNSPIIKALKRAAENGKNVTTIVELKARFDEARNIEWARQLEYSGVQVIYGVRGLKTHAKACIVVRREPQGFQRYVHFGTGNYNEITARFYTDLSYMTCNRELGNDAIAWFNAVTGMSQIQQFAQIESAPIGLREKLLEMISVETDRARNGDKGRILLKLNSLADPDMIAALYKASQAGVQILMNIRGICCLKPGVPGLSENITIVSIIDRFLEHARIMYFYHGGDERVFLSSADWMPRNLDRRVELLVPILDENCKRRAISILRSCLRDNVKGRRIQPDGKSLPGDPGGTRPFRSQVEFQRRAQEAAEAAFERNRTTFVPVEPSGM
ncbi:MAG: polyphosphate kinase 1 [Planctomyces sp.]|nr:polyphosphate kinase 1 [Planctomyces sp.]